MITFDTNLVTFDTNTYWTMDGWSFGCGKVRMSLEQSDIIISLERAQPILMGVEPL